MILTDKNFRSQILIHLLSIIFNEISSYMQSIKNTAVIICSSHHQRYSVLPNSPSVLTAFFASTIGEYNRNWCGAVTDVKAGRNSWQQNPVSLTVDLIVPHSQDATVTSRNKVQITPVCISNWGNTSFYVKTGDRQERGLFPQGNTCSFSYLLANFWPWW